MKNEKLNSDREVDMITFTHHGNFEKTTAFLKAMQKPYFMPLLRKYAQYGLTELIRNTPLDTGVAASSWYASIETSNSGFKLIWSNADTTPQGTPIVILLQYGHGTNGGTYVQGYDFINPTLKPIFDKLSADLWEEVTRS